MTDVVNKKLDTETRKLLAKTGMLGFTENPDFFFTPSAFRKRVDEKDDSSEYVIPKEHWPVFKLAGKNGLESQKMEDDMGHMEYDDDTNVRIWRGKSGSHRIKILESGIKGWNNFYDVNGEEITFRENGGKIARASLEIIPVSLAIDIANAIVDRTVLSPEEVEGLEF